MALASVGSLGAERKGSESVDHEVREAIDRIEAVAANDVQGRNIGPLARHVRGNLARAAASILEHPQPHVAIVTGFYMSHAQPPNCETDGPPGTAMLAAGLSSVGVPCRVCTGEANAPVVRASLKAADPDGRVPLDIVAQQEPESSIAEVDARWRSGASQVSHVVALERCGPSADGRPRNAAGHDIGRYNAPLERLLDGTRVSIGIGDLGNEVGMGSLPRQLVASSVPNGDRIWCKTPCDYPLICGVSNWGAAALLAALALLRPEWAPALAAVISPSEAERHLRSAVEQGGAVSGDCPSGTPYPCLFVDEVSWQRLHETFAEIHRLCGAEAQQGSLARDTAGQT